jgi:hypothetical protein
MAFSKDFELEVDSTYRLTSSNSTSNFEYQLPYSFPTVKGQTRITLGSAYVPESFYNIPSDVQFYDSDPSVPATTNSWLLPAGRYTRANLASTLEAGFRAGTGPGSTTGLTWTTVNVTYSNHNGKFTITPIPVGRVLVVPNSVASFFNFIGVTTNISTSTYPGFTVVTPVTIGLARTIVSDLWANMNSEREQRIYIRISNLDNKVMLPWISTQIFTFSVPLYSLNTHQTFVYLPNDLSVAQTLYLSPNALRANSQMKVQLVWNDGTLVDLNGRNWKFILKVEQDEAYPPVNNMYVD